jgi:hypothetical protein
MFTLYSTTLLLYLALSSNQILTIECDLRGIAKTVDSSLVINCDNCPPEFESLKASLYYSHRQATLKDIMYTYENYTVDDQIVNSLYINDQQLQAYVANSAGLPQYLSAFSGNLSDAIEQARDIRDRLFHYCENNNKPISRGRWSLYIQIVVLFAIVVSICRAAMSGTNDDRVVDEQGFSLDVRFSTFVTPFIDEFLLSSINLLLSIATFYIQVGQYQKFTGELMSPENCSRRYLRKNCC